MPLYRQEKILQRYGIDIARNTLCSWIFKCADLFEPLVKMMKENIINYNYVQCDETPVRVLNEYNDETGEIKSKQGNSYMFVYVGGERKTTKTIIYDYKPTRAGQGAKDFLEGFTGYIQKDGYAGYNVFSCNKNITLVGCWAHARRKFFDIVKITKTPGKAHEALNTIRKLYYIEKIAKAKKLKPKEIKQLRETKSKPILDKFKKWLEKHLINAPPKSSLGQAISYTLKFWDELNQYLTDGILDIDNNAAENAIRPFVVGRKNWLFSDNDKGARASAS